MALVLSTGLVAGLALAPPEAQAVAPDTPSGLTPAGGATVDGLVVLGWDRPDGATRFDVQVDDTADFSSPLVDVTGTVNLCYVPKDQLPGGTLWWRVRGSNGSEVSGWSTESFDHVVQGAPKPIRPEAGTVMEPPTYIPRFAWEPVTGATSYTVQVSSDPEFVDPALVTANTQRTTAAVLTGYQTPGTYYWRVNASLGSGYATAWSTPSVYTVKGLRAAELTAPADSFAAPVRDVVLDWEPVPGAVRYQVQVSTDDAFLTLRDDRTVLGTRYSPAYTYNNDEYYWRVRPVDASGNRPPWPPTPWRFRRAWTDQPTLTYPRGPVSAAIPLFYQWTGIETATKYVLIVRDSSGRTICSVPTVHTTYAGCVPSTAGTYTWQVRAYEDPRPMYPYLPDAPASYPLTTDPPRTDLLAQEPATFSYDPADRSGTDPVTKPAVSMSGTAAYGVGGSTREACESTLPATCVDLRQTPVLTWPAVPGATRYLLTLSYDRELTNLVPDPAAPYSKLADIQVTSTMWTPTMPLPDSQAGSAYFWAVRACTASGCDPVTYPTHSFAKKTVGPRLLSPVGGAVVSDDVTLDWGSELDALRAPAAATGSSLSTAAATDAATYTVQTSIDPGFDTVIETATVDQTTFTSTDTTYPEGPVYWRVRGTDANGNPMAWSDTGQFVKRSQAPTLTTPADGGTLGYDYALSWDPLPFAAAYEVEVYAGPTKVGGSTSWKHASWAPSDPFPASASYTWRVRRIDAAGRKGAWSESRSFKIAGAAPSLVAPAPDAVVAPGTALFTWQSDALATSYRFERRAAGTTTVVESVPTRSTGWAPTTALGAGSWEWRVVALDAAGSSLGASPWRGFSVVDPPAVVTPVTVSGSGAVGTDLRLSAPVFAPVVDRITYQWYRGWAKIPDATGTIYTVTSDDFGQDITVRATGELVGYKPATSTSTPITGGTGSALVAEYPPSIAGRAVVGQTLTVEHGLWPGSPRLSYQWFRGSVAVPGATWTSYPVTAADAGRSIHVVETATPTGRAPATATSTPVTVAKLPSTTSLYLSPSRATVRQRVLASASVFVSGLTAPGGKVTFLDGSRRLASVRLGSGTSVSLKLPRLARGKHLIRAAYSGAAQTRASSRKVYLTVTRR